MSERNGYGGADLLLAFLGGAAVGAIVALLTAPKSGVETREQLSDMLNAGRDRSKALPAAVKAATGAAREAFADALKEKAGTHHT